MEEVPLLSVLPTAARLFAPRGVRPCNPRGVFFLPENIVVRVLYQIPAPGTILLYVLFQLVNTMILAATTLHRGGGKIVKKNN